MACTESESAVPSPCIRNCCLDDNDVCLGCFRTLEEILAWTRSSEPEKAEILLRCAARKRAKFNRR
ncbi:DUF1289 domain-containing protein [Vibrio fluvialis]|uniref:DUF1289 domain-containing protein n=1 Tax=Vibrio fluvialis TaxID=676 RepID=UPI00192C4899|nr:DUF1289 domain-containing protein [Vibrio fluvialis]MBL4239732.1 DUF1289 domain-containing protein [Vibrio fluvialis]MBL4264054.1 DUF1289 domain-containing protein [Vibrio fluvialis]MBL4269086.1 DUF1289 domain-containing protein [Vibrio fluvialis]MBL4273396.1 DUF1289 domain-containing protein [Vibrio fluvialis]MBO1438909.1 DUF1289 domain-containing protein [Vibrio fluvialis]